MKYTRMKALETFTKNIAGSMVHGDPKHPDAAGRFPLVTKEQAEILTAEKLVKKPTQSELAKLEDDGTFDDGEGDDDEDEGATGISNVQGASTAGTDGARSAQSVRDERTDTTTTTGTGAARRKPRGGKAAAPGEAGGAPTGGNDTNASTNHPTTAIGGDGTTSATNGGANSDPAPDAPPTE